MFWQSAGELLLVAIDGVLFVNDFWTSRQQKWFCECAA